MRTIKTRTKTSGIKILDKSVNLSKRMKNVIVRTKERLGETQNLRQSSPAEYASDNIQTATRTAAREIAHNPVKPLQKAAAKLKRSKSHFQEVRRNPPKERRAAARINRSTAKTREKTDKLRNYASKAGETAKEAKAAVKEGKRTLKEVRQSGRRTLREVKQSARAGGGVPKAEAGDTPAKRDFVKIRARARAENARLAGKPAVKPDDPAVNPARGAATPGRPINAPGGYVPISGASRPSYWNGRFHPAKSAGGAAQPAEKSARAVKVRAKSFKAAAKGTVKTAQADQKPANTVKSTAKSFKNTAKGTVKAAKKSVKSAEKTAKAAVKTAQKTAWAAAKTEKRAAKTAKAAEGAARAATKSAVHTTKAAAKAVTAMLRAAVAAARGLAVTIAAGGSVAVLIILIICLIGLLAGSVFGIFFSGELSAEGGKTIKTVIAGIDDEYTARIDMIISDNAHDFLDMSGARAAWKEVLAVYTVKTVSDPNSPMEVATVDDAKAALLRTVFWEMNTISHSVDTADVEEDLLGADGLPTGDTTAVTKTVLRIFVTHKTPAEMATGYGFAVAQTAQLDELLKPAHYALWNALIYGVTSSGDGSMIEIADTQIGNIGGEPYWSWYGFTSRVEWCACFVSWCADQLGYIGAGALPLFSYCDDGIRWFKDRGQWRDGGYTPSPGDIIFFDWEGDSVSDHVGIVERGEGEIVRTIEGNASDSVARRSYALNSVKITGYGLPVYNAP
jgi:hypothetical protein